MRNLSQAGQAIARARDNIWEIGSIQLMGMEFMSQDGEVMVAREGS